METRRHGRKLRRGTGVALGTFLASVLATSAFAAEIAYTLDDPPGPAGFTAGGLTGTIDPFSGLLNAGDTLCLDGTCDLENQDWLVFTLTVTAGSLDDAGVGALFASSLGIGYFLQGGPAQDGTGGTDTYSGDSTSVPTVPVFTFVGNGGGVGLTGTSLPLFVTYANGALPTPSIGFGEGATQFMITEFGGVGIDSPLENVTQLIEIVPEPSTALLLSGGLLLLGATARRSRA